MEFNPFFIFQIIVIFLIVFAALRFRRKIKNTYTAIFDFKKFVVVHVRNPATKFMDTYNVVPNFEGLTSVGEFQYTLRPDNAIMEWKGRLHYLVDKDDTIPKSISERTSKDVLVSVYQVRSALRSKAYDILYGEQKNIALLVCFIALMITIVIAIYALYTINNISPMVETIYQKIQPGQIQIAPIDIPAGK